MKEPKASRKGNKEIPPLNQEDDYSYVSVYSLSPNNADNSQYFS